MLSYRVENKYDFYDTICTWWDDWNFPRFSVTSLPERIFVVSRDGIDLYAMPVYFGDSDLCWIGFITGNKNTTKKDREGSLSFLLSSVESHMNKLGARLCMTVSGTPVLKKLFSDSDYILSGENINEYIKNIQNE